MRKPDDSPYQYAVEGGDGELHRVTKALAEWHRDHRGNRMFRRRVSAWVEVPGPSEV